VLAVDGFLLGLVIYEADFVAFVFGVYGAWFLRRDRLDVEEFVALGGIGTESLLLALVFDPFLPLSFQPQVIFAAHCFEILAASDVRPGGCRRRFVHSADSDGHMSHRLKDKAGLCGPGWMNNGTAIWQSSCRPAQDVILSYSIAMPDSLLPAFAFVKRFCPVFLHL
jgi:hypothetical protein